MNNSVCYVCCCYLGDRRAAIEKYNQAQAQAHDQFVINNTGITDIKLL